MKIAVTQMNPIIGDFAGNIDKMLHSMKSAVAAGAVMVVFPEFALCGYPPMDLLDYDTFVEENRRSLRNLQRSMPAGIAAAVGYVDRNPAPVGKALTNSIAILSNGELIHTQAKTLLPTYDVFDEARYFEPAVKRSVFEFGGRCIGVAICEDLWWETEPSPGTRYPIDPVRDLLDQGADLILAPSASPYYSGKARVRTAILNQIGRTSGVQVVYVNMVGGNDNLIFDGRSMVSSESGSVVYRGPAFVESLGVVNLAELESLPPVPSDMERYAEIEAALCLGIRDYLRKTGFHKVHLGVSGGIDSAVVAYLASKAIGVENTHAFLMPSEYSSKGSISDSEQLCKKIGISYETVAIQPIFSQFLTALGTHYSEQAIGMPEENIQARIRGTLLMAHSNRTGSLVVTTGNKSELAVGYCTLYGDMAGSLAVIGDLLKTEVYALAAHINRDEEIIPRAILTKAPSAELRLDQRDEDSLPPYEILDEILSRYLLRNLTANQIVAEGFEAYTVSEILKMVGQSEYKRRQTPPVLKVSTRAFGTGRRMPLARKIYEHQVP